MGGKKKKTKVGPIKKESKYKIPSRFDCPVCDSKASISVKISRQTHTARVFCTRCRIGSETTMQIKPLEKNVDIFFKFREELLALDHADSAFSSFSHDRSVASQNESRHGLSALAGQRVAVHEASDAADFFGPRLDEEDELDPFR